MKYIFSRTSLFFFFLLLFLFFFIPHVPLLKWGSLDLVSWDKKKGKIVKNIHKESDHWYPLEAIAPMTIAAIIVAEDALFYQHYGIDLDSIFKSAQTNYNAGYIKRGGSTITQQVVRLSFLSQKKSYLRKIREVLGALLLEIFLTKDEILSWYLNLLYWGPGLVGIESASLAYFSLNPKELGLNHSIQLALTLPRPNHYGKQLYKKKLSPKGHRKFYFILNELKNNHYINQAEWENSFATGNFGSPILIQKKNKK